MKVIYRGNLNKQIEESGPIYYSFQVGDDILVRYSLGRGRKGKTASTKVGYLYSGQEGRQLA